MNSALRNVVFAILLAALAAACNEPPPEPVGVTPEPAAKASMEAEGAIAPGEYSWTTADGNTMPYVVTGEGETTVLLVHCWMCDRTFWSRQVPALAARYRTIAVDLPGHGAASANRENWHIEDLGADVAGLIRELDLDDVVLVGHSMGGPVSLRAAALLPNRVRGIVAVDTLHDA